MKCTVLSVLFAFLEEIPSKLQATGGKDDSYAEQARNGMY